MSFLFPSLALLGTGLVLLPLVVHLISRRRRQRIAWAAMDFLLDSDKKNRNRSRLEEWLLLLLRMLAVGLAALLAAVPQLPQQLSDWFEGSTATHVVILDDSYSMTELTTGGQPWQAAKDAVQRLIKRCEATDATIHLIRYTDALTDKKPLVVSQQNRNSLGIKRTELATGPVDALRQAQQLLVSEALADERCYVTVLSDFRRRDHANNVELDAVLEAIGAEAAGMLLAPCASSSQRTENFTLAEFVLAPGPRALGVEATARVVITCRSESPAAKQLVQIHRDQRLVTSFEVGPFEPGETIEQTFPLFLSEEGTQTLVASLPNDSLEADNHRGLVLDLPPSRRVLIVDGSSEGREGVAFSAALAPQRTLLTGWRPRVIRKKNIGSLGDLSTTAVVFLLDVPRLGPQAKNELHRFVERGGGLLNILGPQSDRAYYNAQFADDDLPLMPVRLDLPTQTPWSEPGVSMLQVNDHPTLRILSGQRNGFLPLLRIGMCLATETTPTPITESQVLLQLTDGSPLLLEHSLGKGRVMTLLTTATAQNESLPWSNLATLPIFPVLVNEIAGWLSQTTTAPIDVVLGSSVLHMGPRLADAKSWQLEQAVDGAGWESLRKETETTALPLLTSGTYRVVAQQRSTASLTGEISFAANVNPEEGDLETLSFADLRNRFDSFADVVPVDELFQEADEQRSWQPMLMAGLLLLALLTGERLLATRCSYINALPKAAGGAV